jgi:hypothetical protein
VGEPPRAAPPFYQVGTTFNIGDERRLGSPGPNGMLDPGETWLFSENVGPGTPGLTYSSEVRLIYDTLILDYDRNF